ncbi:hypothetical protein [Amaricoccus sp.]|uniref:hypothetical protein n=1 Tax=Amaricoccus sp. TaxID=1872485 RepID=UPI001B4C624D|nr:hypothetical protein [Amaricoccus sp.]MBP7002785.1 hypothetical protein [Amaricoccus sp.]
MGWQAALAGAAALWAGAAAADPFDSTPLFAVGSWSVEHTYDAGAGGSWCAADTVNAEGQWLSVVGYDSGEAAILVGDPGWRMAEGAVRFRIDVDGVGWDVDGSGGDGSVAVLLDDAAAAATFLSGLAEGAEADVYSEAGRRLAAFPLDGARRALEELVRCWSRIEPADPFATATAGRRGAAL